MSGHRIPEDLAWVLAEECGEDDGRVYLMLLPDRGPYELNGVAGVIWRAAVSGDAPIEAVAEATEREAVEIESVVRDFLGSLVAAGFLEESE